MSRLARWLKPEILDRVLELLGRSPIVSFDLGARSGPYYLRDLREFTRIYGFEPDIAEWEKLNAAGGGSRGFAEEIYFPSAVSNSDGVTTLQLLRDPYASSVLSPNLDLLGRYEPSPVRENQSSWAEDFEVVSTLECETVSLDRFVTDKDIGYVDFVKLDTQGNELDIIQGGAKVFGESVLVVHTEVEFVEMYRSQGLFRDIDARMNELGFTLLDIETLRRKRRVTLPKDALELGELIYASAVYSKDVTGQMALLDWHDTGRVVKLMLILNSMGFSGYALDVAQTYAATGLPDNVVIDGLAQSIKKKITPSRAEKAARSVDRKLIMAYDAVKRSLRPKIANLFR